MNNMMTRIGVPTLRALSLCAILVAVAACSKPSDESTVEAEAAGSATQEASEQQTEAAAPTVAPEREPHENADHQGGEHAASNDHAAHDHAAHDHAAHDHAAHDHATNSGSEVGGGSAGMEHVVDDYDASEVVLQPNAEPGDLTQCTVSGEVFRVTEEHSWLEHGEGRVYFCCPGCIRRFQREPARWLATQNVAPGAPGQDAAAE